MINKKAQEKCLDIVNEFNGNVDIASEDINNLLKSECETYGELLKAIDFLKKGVIWNRLLKESDIITCHCPLTNETKGMINEETITKMKKSAIFINTSRGPVVDEKALANALNNEMIQGAGLDVLSVEPADKDNPLLNAKNCYITPHIAWAAKETRARLLGILEDNLKAYIDGHAQNVVNK